MKKTLVALCCLAVAMLFLPHKLPAPTVCMQVTKACTDAVAPGEPIPFSGTVINCGLVALENVTVVDNNGTLGDASDDFTVFGPETLAAGASANYSGSYYPAGSPSTNTVTATAKPTGYSWIISATASATCTQPEDEGGCRVTGGGNATAGLALDGLWDGTFATDKLKLGRSAYNEYTFGGQAGARTALLDPPSGEWEHHQKAGADGDFSFHGGGKSAPPGTVLFSIICRDETGPCIPAPAGGSPFKQINFEGLGTMQNIKDAPALGDDVPGEKYYYFQVYIEDNGEGGGGRSLSGGPKCPPVGRGDAFANPEITGTSDCDCADFYRIRIFKGVVPEFDADGNLTNRMQMESQPLIYQVYGYIDGGNLQIHPLTGFDR